MKYEKHIEITNNELIKAIYPEQQKIIENVSKQKKHAIFLEAGNGKTFIATMIMLEKILDYGIRDIIILTPMPSQYLQNIKTYFKKPTKIIENILNNIGIIHTSKLPGKHKSTDYLEQCKKPIKIMTYHTITTMKKYIKINTLWNKNKEQCMIILDEAHKINNKTTNTYRTINTLLKSCDTQLLLTATPAGNNYGEIHTIYRILNPNLIPQSKVAFEQYIYSDYPWNKLSNPNNINYFKEIYKPYITQGKFKQIEEIQGEHKIQKKFFSLTNIQNQLYDIIKEVVKNKIKYKEEKTNVLFTTLINSVNNFNYLETPLFQEKINTLETKLEIERLLHAHRNEISPKEQYLNIKLQNHINNREKCILWSNHPKIIEYYTEKFKAYSPLEITTNTTTSKQKTNLIDEFNNTDKYNILLTTFKFLGIAVSIRNANFNYLIDTPTSYIDFDQAIRRNYGINRGIENNITTTTCLFYRNTIEESIYTLLKRKKSLKSFLHKKDTNAIDYLISGKL